MQVGGRCASVHVDGYRFDTGPSLLLFPDTYRSTLASLGTTLEQHVALRRVEPAAYRVFFAGTSGDNAAASSMKQSDVYPSSMLSDADQHSSRTSSTSTSSRSSRHSHQDSTPASLHSSLDLLYDVQAMVNQLEQVEQGAGKSGSCSGLRYDHLASQ